MVKLFGLVWFRGLYVFGLSVSYSLCFLLTPSNSLGSSLSMKTAKELLKEERKETKMPIKFQLYFWVSYGYSVARYLFRLFREQLRLPNKALKCSSRFRWLITPKLGVLVVGYKSMFFR